MSLFGKNKSKEVCADSRIIESLKERVKELTDIVEAKEQCNKDDRRTFEENLKDMRRDMDLMQEDHDLAMRNNELVIDNLVKEATASLEANITRLTIEKSKATQEAEILRTAFKNLGFDVKDMKEIMSSLVDGIVSKNTVNVIK